MLAKKVLVIIVLVTLVLSCVGSDHSGNVKQSVLSGDQQTEIYFPKLKNKKVGILVNQTSVINQTHLLDTLLRADINVVSIFVPEHGFRGTEDAGSIIDDSVDAKTGIPIISLHGQNRKPQSKDLQGLDVIVFDLQDVGVRFYTYISTLHLLMEACGENNVSVMVLDRPNPNGDYIDGPVLDTKFSSFVGMDPIPVVYGMTIGEMAMMINGEGWLKDSVKCDLEVIKINGYNRHKHYTLDIKPSPNLPNDIAVRLYPSLCFFEATEMSIGRGTEFPFQVIGYPDSKFGNFEFTPVSIKGMSMNPKHKNELCYGIDLRDSAIDIKFTLSYLINFYNGWDEEKPFFESPVWLNLLAGTDQLLNQIKSGMTEEMIRKSWEPELLKFKGLRMRYLLYDD